MTMNPMFELTPEQAGLVALIITFFPLFFQLLLLLAAQPVIAPVLAWIYKRLAFVPGTPTDWKRIATGLLAAALMYLFVGLSFLTSPPAAPAFSTEGLTLFFTWALNSVLSLFSLIAALTMLYEKLWRGLFKSDVPVLSALDPANIDKLQKKNE